MGSDKNESGQGYLRSAWSASVGLYHTRATLLFQQKAQNDLPCFPAHLWLFTYSAFCKYLRLIDFQGAGGGWEGVIAGLPLRALC